jgi:hypothetical protein
MTIPGSSTIEVPVLMVGAGPAGLALSAALSRYGVAHLHGPGPSSAAYSGISRSVGSSCRRSPGSEVTTD